MAAGGSIGNPRPLVLTRMERREAYYSTSIVTSGLTESHNPRTEFLSPVIISLMLINSSTACSSWLLGEAGASCCGTGLAPTTSGFDITATTEGPIWVLVRGVWALVRGVWALVRGAWALVRGAWALVRVVLDFAAFEHPFFRSRQRWHGDPTDPRQVEEVCAQLSQGCKRTGPAG
jgi:hypothetical protein